MIGENVLREREHAGFSQDELADRSGIPRETINRIEKGKQEVRMLTLLPIARALGVPLMSLLNGLLD
jgi:transcriptional regulator with XRE-family HTH domain